MCEKSSITLVDIKDNNSIMAKNYISKNFKGDRYYALPQIDAFMKDAEWKMFTVLFNRIMTLTNHGNNPNGSVEISHQWLSSRIVKSLKQSQRIIANLEEIGVIIVRRMTQKSNRYRLNWDCINELAESQIYVFDENDSYIEDIEVLESDKKVSYIEDEKVSIRIKKIKLNKENNKVRNTISTGTVTMTNNVSASDLSDIPNKVLSSCRLATARTETHNLQYPCAALASHPRVAPTPLSPLEQNAREWADKLYYHSDNFTGGELERYVAALSNTVERERHNFTAETVSKIDSAIAFIENLLR